MALYLPERSLFSGENPITSEYLLSTSVSSPSVPDPVQI